MNKKVFIFSLILIFTLAFASFSYASDIIMDLNSTDSNTDNTIYSSNPGADDTTSSDTDATDDTFYDTQMPLTSTTTEDYDVSTDLSITNMINIVLIVVGVVLILLGIAIIIKLK